MLNKNVRPFWLVSYPKSGNTWLRLFLSALIDGTSDINCIATDAIISDRRIIDEYLGIDSADFPEKDLIPYKGVLFDKWSRHQTVKEYLLCKVHDACSRDGYLLFPPGITRGTVYVVRNPFDIAASLANHNAITIQAAVAHLCDPDYLISGNFNKLGAQLPQYLGTWAGHTESWETIHGKNMLVLRYEDMLRHPDVEFCRVVNYLGLNYSAQEIRTAISRTTFDQLKKQESASGFSEAPSKAGVFFRSGQAGGWRNELTRKEVEEIIKYNHSALLRYGYMNRNGDILI